MYRGKCCVPSVCSNEETTDREQMCEMSVSARRQVRRSSGTFVSTSVAALMRGREQPELGRS
jgi:hypothetical protein